MEAVTTDTPKSLAISFIVAAIAQLSHVTSANQPQRRCRFYAPGREAILEFDEARGQARPIKAQRSEPAIDGTA